MGNPFTEEFWVGSGPGQAGYHPEKYDPNVSAFTTGETGRDLSRMLMARARGEAPSVAEEQMKMGLGRALAGGQAMSRSAPGVSAGMALRLAQNQAGDLMGRTNMQQGVLRAKEQAAAESRLGQWLQQQMAARMALEQMRAGQQNMYNQLMMQRDIYNAGAQAQPPGLGGALLSAGGTAAGYALGGPAGAAVANQAIGGSPQWSDYGWGAPGDPFGA